MKHKPEKIFQYQSKKDIEFLFPDSYCLNIPDSYIQINGIRIAHKKDFDSLFTIQGKPYAIEFKSHRAHTAWQTSEVKPHQFEGLEKARNALIEPLVIINVKFWTKKGHENFAALFDPANLTQKSYPVEQLRKHAIYRVKINGHLVWDYRLLGKFEEKNLQLFDKIV